MSTNKIPKSTKCIKGGDCSWNGKHLVVGVEWICRKCGSIITTK